MADMDNPISLKDLRELIKKENIFKVQIIVAGNNFSYNETFATINDTIFYLESKIFMPNVIEVIITFSTTSKSVSFVKHAIELLNYLNKGELK